MQRGADPATKSRHWGFHLRLSLTTALDALLVGIALTSILPVSLVLLVAWGVASILVIANGITLRQQLTPDRRQPSPACARKPISLANPG